MSTLHRGRGNGEAGGGPSARRIADVDRVKQEAA